jgi:CheY-like chemotaxis protein
MGGNIGVNSTPGRGSHFFFTARFGLQAGGAPNPPPLRLGALSGARILVVDDNDAAREVILGMSLSLGLRAEAVANGPQAIHAVVSASAGRQSIPCRAAGLENARNGWRGVRTPAARRLAVASAADGVDADGLWPRRSAAAAGQSTSHHQRCPHQAGHSVDLGRCMRGRAGHRTSQGHPQPFT